MKKNKAKMQNVKKSPLRFLPFVLASLPGIASCVLLNFVLDEIRELQESGKSLALLVEEKALEVKDLSERQYEEEMQMIAEESSSLHGEVGNIKGILTGLDSTYGNLLEAQKRRTLETLYDEETIASKLKEASSLFQQGRYINSSRLYGEVAEAQKDNSEARFYQYYALFLSNKGAYTNYSSIEKAFRLLRLTGYTRKEIDDTLLYIAGERGGERKNEGESM